MRLAPLAPLLVAIGCTANRSPAFDRARTVLGPVPLKDRIAWVDTALDRVVALDLTGDTPRVEAIPIGRNAVYATPSADRDHLLVITRGEEALARGREDEPPRLWDVDLAHPAADPVAYQVDSPFDRIAV